MDWIMPVPLSSMEENWGGKKLHRLVEQLKLHKWPRMDEENNEKIGANCGIRNYVTNKNEEFGCVNWRERRAAVLICLFEGSQGELRVILTKRSMNLASHPGDVALPGGKMEETDEDDTATALREAMEEIGLDPSLVHVVGNLEPFISQHQLKVIPVISVIDRIQDFKPLINTSEVDAVFHAPLDMFLKASLFHLKNEHEEKKPHSDLNQSLRFSCPFEPRS
ncbi:hypothetical protein FNV43_RR08769 [Rhamnella rubrinervis]|uniref:Nudix hydrolase domain-containing protein n=1 Tax=Rhamnella rubrinervis TaxID=2594499 RepID=A0A8K0H973_9ROSA|nr:hypothetical protein FNV43_RR08769 [Rhamnella rubrinervis]